MSPKHHMSPSPNSVRYSREQPSGSRNQNLLPSSKVRFIFQWCLWLCCYTSEDNTWPMAKFAGPITTWLKRPDWLLGCRLVNRTCTESGLIIMFIIILVITIIIIIVIYSFLPNRISLTRKPSSYYYHQGLGENFPKNTGSPRLKLPGVYRLHVVDLHLLCDRKIAAPPAMCCYIGWIFGAGGRRPPQKCGGYRHLPSVKLAMAMHWASVDLDPMTKMAKNHPANASSREIIKAHMAQWSCHVARTSYHLCFEGSKNPLPKHRMRAGWEFVVCLS